MNPNDPSPLPLPYASPRPTRRTVRPVRLTLSLACVAIGVAGYFVGRANFTFPVQDPPPDNDPFWVEHNARQRRLEIGCCGGLPTGCIGLGLLFTCFPRRRVHDGDPAAE